MGKAPLDTKTCTPCHSSTPPLLLSEAQKRLTGLGNGWLINEAGHLYKAYNFKDFMGAMAFANKIADLAEKENHHPNLTIAWGSCAVEIWTHKVGGLTENDFILAGKIDELRK